MNAPLDHRKFVDPKLTAKQEVRASVDFNRLETVWFNTGSLCNITCDNCYIASSPRADHFVYLTPEDVRPYLEEVDEMGIGPIEIGITGGEPFMNPHIIQICDDALARGHDLLILTNAMKPMMRPRIQSGLVDLLATYPDRITLRISFDHYSAGLHDKERGAGSFDIALTGADWLSENGFRFTLAGRAAFSETEQDAREGFEQLAHQKGWKLDAYNPAELILFPEMDESVDVPEITTACWDILGKSPNDMMCASSRMIVRRKGSSAPIVLSCTLLWNDPQFELGQTLSGSFIPVSLNHPHCAKFCVLGGASCSV